MAPSSLFILSVGIFLLSFQCVVSVDLIVSCEPWVDRSQDTTLTCSSSAGLLQVGWREGDDFSGSSSIVLYDSYQTPSVQWDDSADQSHYTFDETSDGFPLTIKSVTLDDEGRYWCQALDNVTFSYTTNSSSIAVRVPPNTATIAYEDVTYSGGSISVISGNNRQFTCNVPGIKPAAVFSWATAPLQPTETQTDTPSSSDNRLVDSSNTITVDIPETPAQQQLRCGATNRQDGSPDVEVDITVSLQVKVPPNESAMTLTSTGTILPGDRVSVTQGTEHTFTCLVQGTRPAATIKWFLNDVLQDTIDPNPGGDSDDLVDTSSDWSFIPLRSNHRQTVKCEASTAQTTLPAPSVMLLLEVNGPPDTPVISSNSPTMTENVPTTLTCRADLGYPDSWSLVWFKGTETITGTAASVVDFNNRYNFTSTSDEFTPVREDNGQTSIKCVAQWDSWNSANPEGSLILSVQFCARSVSVTNCPTAIVGNTAVLRCVSDSSNPATTLTWSRDGLDQTDTSPQPESDGNSGGIITTLDITTNVLTKNDNGAVFQCSASNDVVSCGVDGVDVIDSCTLNVQYTPEFTEVTVNPETPVIEGGEVILTCTADANPKPSNFITWEKVNSSSTVPNSVHSDGTSTLTLSVIQRDQAGIYRCKANNEIPSSGSDLFSELVTVKVHYEVKITNKDDTEMGVNDGEDAVLSCKAVGNPAPVMTWYDPNNTVISSSRNPDKYQVDDTTTSGNDIYGFMVTSNLTIQGVDSQVDYGLYTCNSSNGIGQVDMLMVLLVGTRRPNKPTIVVMTDRTSSSIAVRWTAGYDGGEPQWFHVSHKKTADSLETFSDRIEEGVTTYNVNGLESYTQYEIRVYAENDVDRNPNPGSIVEYTMPLGPSSSGFTIEFNTVEGKVQISGLAGKEGCIQLEVKYEGSSEWKQCGKCIKTDEVVILADRCPQTRKRRRRAAGDVVDVRASFCRENEGVGLCSKPEAVREGYSTNPTVQTINPGVIAGVVVGVVLLVVIIALVYFLGSRLQCHIEVTRKSPSQIRRSDRNRTDADKQPVYQDVTEMVAINSDEETTAYANLPNAQKAFQRNKLHIVRELGRGNFGKVLLAQAEGILESSKVTLVAVKTMKDGAKTSEKESAICELELMKKLPEHCNVVKLLGYCIQQDPPYIIVEYLCRGNLKDLLKDSRSKEGRVYGNLHGVSRSLTSRDLLKFASDVADGMTFISSQQCIHRDLAARNILVAEDMTCKVSDFGLARDVMNIRVYERGSDGRLPLRWMAIESILDDVYTTKSDVWSYGILLWEIVTLGARPYPTMSAKKMIDELQNGYRMPKPNHCQEELYQVMQKCWKEDPKVRPSFKVISHKLKKLANTGKDCISVKVYEEAVYEVTISDDQSEKV